MSQLTLDWKRHTVHLLDIAKLVVQMASANQVRGYTRIRGAFGNLSIEGNVKNNVRRPQRVVQIDLHMLLRLRRVLIYEILE